MAAQSNSTPTKSPFKVITFLEGELGRGSYGSVHKVRCDSLLCAAKKIHEALILPPGNTPSKGGHRIPTRRFEAEFRLLQELRHPNIIQYLGMYWDPESKMYILMELMDQSLKDYIEESKKDIPYHLQVNICYDVSRALSHLHVNDIVHRDLSSNNVLLCGETRKAKLSDFGMAKCVNTKISTLQSPTGAPGTQFFMPPEALESQEEFQPSGDVFSLGVNVVSILSREFPKPAGSRYRDVVINGEKLKRVVPEVERRRQHIALISEDHPLLPIALDCLDNEEFKRPSAADVCVRLESILDTDRYRISKKGDYQESGTSTCDLVTTEDKAVGGSEPMSADPQPSTDEQDYMMIDIDPRSTQKIAQLEETVAARDFRIEGLIDELSIKKNVVDKLLTDYSTLETTIKELHLQAEGNKSSYDDLQAENTKLRQATKDLKEDMDKLNTVKSEEIDELKCQLLKEKNLYTEQRSSLLQVSSDLVQRNTEIDESKARIENLESQLQAQTKIDKKKSSSKRSGSINPPVVKEKPQGASNEKLPTNTGTKAPSTLTNRSDEKPPILSENTKKEKLSSNKASPPEKPIGFFAGLFASNKNSSAPEAKPTTSNRPKTKPTTKSNPGPTNSRGTAAGIEAKPGTINRPKTKSATKSTPEPANSRGTAISRFTSPTEEGREEKARERIVDSSKRSLATLEDSERKGTSTLENLATQTESLNRSEQRLDEMKEKLKPQASKKPHTTMTPLGELPSKSSIRSPKPSKPKQHTTSQSRTHSKEDPIKPSKSEQTKSESSPGLWSRLFSSKKPEEEVKPGPPKRPMSSLFQTNPFQTQSQLETEREQLATQRMIDSSRRSLALLNGTEQMGGEIAGNLAVQHEQLDRAEQNVDEVSFRLGIKPSTEYKSGLRSASSKSTGASSRPTSKPTGRSSLDQYPSTGSEVADRNLAEMEKALNGLKSVGEAIGGALDDSNAQIGRVTYKMGRNKEAIRELEKKH